MSETTTSSSVASPHRPPLPTQINIATRSLHSQLNKLIISRLPLGLPPHAQTPQPYALGLHHFAHIYLTFESLWSDLSSSSQVTGSLHSLLDDPWISVTSSQTQSTSQPYDAQVVKFLSTLLPQAMMRSKRLRNDLATLNRMSAIDLSVHLSQFPSKQVRDFATHIRQSVSLKPHVLIAYGWVMYMAIFSGGRWIRGELVNAGPEFWNRIADQAEPLSSAGLSFWSFDGDHDGEDIKATFKQRLSHAEEVLSSEQRQDIVEEAKEIFRQSILLVGELDEMLGTSLPDKEVCKTGKKDDVAEQEPIVPRIAQPPLAEVQRYWFSMPGVAGVVLAASCISWYAMYHAGTWF